MAEDAPDQISFSLGNLSFTVVVDLAQAVDPAAAAAEAAAAADADVGAPPAAPPPSAHGLRYSFFGEQVKTPVRGAAP